jgi:hypothetical protein
MAQQLRPSLQSLLVYWPGARTSDPVNLLVALMTDCVAAGAVQQPKN